jgi:hypothetical protein
MSLIVQWHPNCIGSKHGRLKGMSHSQSIATVEQQQQNKHVLL